jgi:hypothetical protein
MSRLRHTAFVLSTVLVALAQAGSLAQDERPVSVFVVDVAGNGRALTSAKDGVLFDLDRKGTRSRVGWTAPNSDDAFVVLDVNRNGRIDDGSEMLGDGWRLASGARVDSSLQALLVVQGFSPDAGERPGPRGIAWIDGDDAVFARLRLWTDTNHNGQSESTELRTLPDARLRTIYMSFSAHKQPAPDAQGNTTRTLGTVTFERDPTWRERLDEFLGRVLRDPLKSTSNLRWRGSS